jgi:amidase
VRLAAPAHQPAAPQRFSVVEASISQLRAAMAEGRVTSREIVQQYLTRIALYEDKLNAAITINPRALAEADARDRERAQGKRWARCTGSRSRSRTTSTPPTCPPPAARWPSTAWCRPIRPP